MQGGARFTRLGGHSRSEANIPSILFVRQNSSRHGERAGSLRRKRLNAVFIKNHTFLKNSFKNQLTT
jgi:hypothetical protein